MDCQELYGVDILTFETKVIQTVLEFGLSRSLPLLTLGYKRGYVLANEMMKPSSGD